MMGEGTETLGKRLPEREQGGGGKKVMTLAVHAKRVRNLPTSGQMGGDGPVLYWMSRDQRVRDNWALLHALQSAGAGAGGQQKKPVAIVFNLVTEFMGAGARQFVFMLEGLRRMQPILKELNIPFYLVQGHPEEQIPKLVKECNASLLVTDYSPLRLGREWRDKVASSISIPFHEVDAHNVVPVWIASGMYRLDVVYVICPSCPDPIPRDRHPTRTSMVLLLHGLFVLFVQIRGSMLPER